jgi:hypothetical protein
MSSPEAVLAVSPEVLDEARISEPEHSAAT